MRFVIGLAIISISLAILTTIGSAWSMTAFAREATYFIHRATPPLGWYYTNPEGDRPVDRAAWRQPLAQAGVHRDLPAHSASTWAFVPPSTSGYDYIAFDAAGWPMLSLTCTTVRTAPPPDATLAEQYRARKTSVLWGLPVWVGIRPKDSLGVLPLRPIWPGFLVNSAMFAAAWFIVVGVPTSIKPMRQALRRRRGRCPRCAYDLLEEFGGGCPECGWRREASDE